MNQEHTIKNRVDYKLLTQTLSVQSFLDDDDDMLSFIYEKLSHIDAVVQTDEFGNIYVTKGKAKSYPCVVAHTDTVQNILSEINIYRNNDTIFAFDPINRRQYGIGGDDKVGVYITLQFLKDLSTLKAVFFREEESGRHGSNYSVKHHKDWYSDCGFVLMADRRGNTDLISVSGGIAITSDEFIEDTKELCELYKYEENVGTWTDVDVLSREGIGVSCTNFSCGYYEPHTSKEIVSIQDVNKCYNLMYDIISKFGDKRFDYEVYIPPYKAPTVNKKTKHPLYNSLSNLGENGISTPLRQRQLKIHLPLILGNKTEMYDNFMEIDVIIKNKKVYNYKGTKALPVTGDAKCSTCNQLTMENVSFLPYSGRMYCANCNDYVNDKDVPMLLKALEVEDGNQTFVYSVYSNGWLKKDQAVWKEQYTSWVSDELPF